MLYNLLISAPKGFPDSSSGKELTCQCKRHKRPEFNPGSGGSPGGGNGNPLQYSCLGNSEDRGACRATVYGVAKSWTQLSMHTCTDLKLSKRTSSMISGPLLMRYREVSHHSLWPWVISLFLFLSVFAVIQLLSHVWLFVTPWTAACQASLSFSISQSLLKLVSIELVVLFKHLSHPLSPPSPPALSLSQHQGLFLWVDSLHQVAKVLELPLVAQMVKNPPAVQETQVQSLDQEDPLKEGMATHSSILAWKIPWTEKPDWL